MVSTANPKWQVTVETKFLPEHSKQSNEQYVFSYTITIANKSKTTATLLSRRWVITDANGEETVVEGEGVVGEQPSISPNSNYTYTSGSVFNTPIGTMKGHYQMLDENQQTFTVDIPVFRLAIPNILN